MDYEKKYKEALERAKKNECLENIFPELKESEDEKMREMAIKAIYASEAQSCIKSWGVNPDDVIAWLEKQCKKDVQVILPTFTFDDILALQCYMKTVKEVQKDEELYNQLQSLHDRLHDAYWLERQCVQKPIISNNALREGIAHFGITQYQIDNWLKKYVDVEKQSDHKPAPKFNVGDTMRTLQEAANGYTDGMPVVVSIDNEYYYCNNELISIKDQDDYEFPPINMKQKPADKVEPKFKVGDWITNSIETVQITGYDIDYGYQVDYKGNLQHRDTDIIEKEYHLWTIQDAKDGDVLYTTCGGKNKMIFIYNGIDIDSVCCYCLYSITNIEYKMFNTVCVIKSDICPATKEQRDILMKAIADAGYEWDFEVKELNKIEKKPSCSEKEKQLLFKDLCARLPYKVRCKCVSGLGGGETEKGVLKYVGNCYVVISNYYEGVPLHSGFVNNVFYPIENIKPYLRPLSSMTEEEFQKLRSICPHSMINKTNVTGWFVGINGSDYGRISRVDEISEFIDWLNAHHFDYRSLIKKGLALEAPEGMYS